MRSRFTALLRQIKLQYTTHPNYVSIGYYHFYFDDVFDHITIVTPLFPKLSIGFPYSTPDRVLHKYYQFKEHVRKQSFFIELALN